MVLMDIFNKENELLMFYHTTLRNIITLTTLTFVGLTFFNNNKKYLLFGELISLIIISTAIYLNYTLIKIFYDSKYKSYKYINKYFKINLLIAIVHIIFAIIIIKKIKNNLL